MEFPKLCSPDGSRRRPRCRPSRSRSPTLPSTPIVLAQLKSMRRGNGASPAGATSREPRSRAGRSRSPPSRCRGSNPFPRAPAIPPAASVPLPPGRDAPEVSETESFPLPPVRPPGFGAPTQSTTPERHASRPEVTVAPPAAPTDNRNVIEKLFGWSHSSSPVVASTTRRAPPPPSRSSLSNGSENRAGGLGRGPLVQLPVALWKFGPAPISGYDRYTAVYDISARVVYLPDGTRLEAHSGLGAGARQSALRGRARSGPDAAACLRADAAGRLLPRRPGDTAQSGRRRRNLWPRRIAGPPVHARPNGNSNGCVSFKDYKAFLRAYENGQIKKLAVVAKL